VHGVLVATNFFGVNTIPIGMNEADYIRMWNQAADTQSTYDGVTAMAVDSIPDTPPSPITLIPGVGEAATSRPPPRIHYPGASPNQRRSPQRWGSDEQQAARRQGRDEPAIGGQPGARWPHQ
jgi:PPE-repeat protein